MTTERDPMTLNESSVPALGGEERSDEVPRAGRARPTPDPEVVAKPKRRQFTAQYRLRILEEAERCAQPGEVGVESGRGRKPTVRNCPMPWRLATPWCLGLQRCPSGT